MRYASVSSGGPFFDWISSRGSLLLVLLAVVIIFPGLGEGSLRDWDEAIYAQVAREIVQSGDWVTLHFGYQPFFEKPPLLMWLTALFFKFFGVNEFWARAVSALSGVLLTWVTYLVGKTIYDYRTGFLAGLTVLGSYGFVFEARNGETDMLLSLFVFSGILAYLGVRKGNPKWWYLAWISCALAFMVKFWAGLVLPATLILVLLLERQTAITIKTKHFWLGILPAMLIVIPWHILVYMQNGQAFIDVYVARDLLERTHIAMEGHLGTPLFYPDALRRLFAPWYFVLPFALALAIKEIIEKKENVNILVVEILLIVGLYTYVVNTKNPSYIFPVFPAMSILTAHLFMVTISNSSSSTFAWVIIAVLIATTTMPDKLLILCILVLVILAILFKMNIFPKSIFIHLLTGFVFVVFILSNIIGYVFGNHRLRVWPIYGMQASSVSQIAILARQNHSPVNNPLICFAMQEDWASEFAVEGPTAIFYSNRPIVKILTWEQLEELMTVKEIGEILIAKKYLPLLSNEFEVLILEEVNHLIYAKIEN